MGVIPEPARRADDVSRLVPNASHFEDEAVAWLPRAIERRVRSARERVCRGFLLGEGEAVAMEARI